MLQWKDLRGPLPAPPPCPTSSGNWKIIRSENFEDLLKVLGKEIFDRQREEGCRGIGGGYEKEREAEPGRGKRAPTSPRIGARRSGSWGAGPDGIPKSFFLRRTPTGASCCGDSASESSRNQKHEVGISWGEARGFSAVQKLHTLRPG